MIVDEDELELVNTTRMHGKAELSHYFVNNSKLDDWHLVAGTVKGRSAVLVFDPHARWQSEIFQANRLCGGYARRSQLGAIPNHRPALYFLPSLPSANYGAAQRTARPMLRSEAHSFRLLPRGDLALKTRVRWTGEVLAAAGSGNEGGIK